MTWDIIRFVLIVFGFLEAMVMNNLASNPEGENESRALYGALTLAFLAGATGLLLSA